MTLNAGLGQGDLPVIKIANQRASAEIYAHGAHLTSWKVDGKELLFLSSKAIFQPPKAIRGGVPVCLPQFAKRGPLQQHGFARNVSWELAAGSGSDGVELTLDVSDAQAREYGFDGRFSAAVHVSLAEDGTLRQQLTVTNTDSKPLPITTALHTYFRVSDASSVKVLGLQGLTYEDTAAGGGQATQEAAALTFPGEVDRIYTAVPGDIVLEDPGQQHRIVLSMEGFADAVLWNPGEAKAAAMSDMGAGEYTQMVCIEAAAATSGPVVVAPQATWTGVQHLPDVVCLQSMWKVRQAAIQPDLVFSFNNTSLAVVLLMHAHDATCLERAQYTKNFRYGLVMANHELSHNAEVVELMMRLLGKTVFVFVPTGSSVVEQVLLYVESHVSDQQGATLASLAQQTRMHVLQRHYSTNNETNYTTNHW